jgi:hypothetical protein
MVEKQLVNEHESKTAGIISTVMKIVAYPVAAAAAFMSGNVHVKGNIYKTFAKRGYFGSSGRSRDGVQKILDDKFEQVVLEKYKDAIERIYS